MTPNHDLKRRFALGPAAACALLACLVLGACFDVRLFGKDDRILVGKYRLLDWEDGHKYLVTPTTGGFRNTVEGGVLRIGWDSRHIVVQQQTRLQSRPSWFIVDVATDSLVGPLDSIAAAATSIVVQLRPVAVDSAWARLRT